MARDKVRLRSYQKVWCLANPLKLKQYAKTYYEKHKFKVYAKNRLWYKNNAEKCRAYARQWWRKNGKRCYYKSKYGITLDGYQNLLTRQNGRCAICKEQGPKDLHVDHNHLTGNIRGLLCNECNHGIGNFKDNSVFLQNAIEYLGRKYDETTKP